MPITSHQSQNLEERYLIGPLLGGTGIAYVHKAIDTMSSNEVVIKFLRPYFVYDGNAELIANYFSFLDSIKTLESDSILKPLDYGSSKESIWVVYPYSNLQSLEDIIRLKELFLSPSDVVSIVNKASESLECMHANNIFHNNLKPSNIFVSKDFLSLSIEGLYMCELAQSASELTKLSLNTPHPYYSSFEHSNGNIADESNDIYSLASIAYHLLTRNLPFSGSRESVLHYKSVQSPKLPSDITPLFNHKVDSVFSKALNRRPSERYRSSRDFAEALEEALKDIEIPVASEPEINVNNVNLDDDFNEYVCIYCGQQNNAQDKLCRKCWSPLTEDRFTTVEKAEKKEQNIVRTLKLNRFTRWTLVIGSILLLSWGGYVEFLRPPPFVPIASTSVLTAVSDPGEWALHGRNLENWSSVDNDELLSTGDSAIKGEIVWVKDTGKPLIASSSIKDDKLIIPTSAGKILALNPYTGDEIWEFPTSGPIDSSPVITDSIAYVGLRDGRLLALNTSNGELIWEFDSGDPIMVSPLVFKGSVYFGTGNGSVYALDAVNGDYLWNFTSDGWITATPVINDDTIVISNSRAWVYVIDTKTGTARLTYNTYGKKISGPVLIDDNVLFGLGTGKLLSINTLQKEYRFERPARFWRLQFYLWGFQSKAPVQKGFAWSSRVARPDAGLTALSVLDDKAYFGTSDGYAMAFDLEMKREPLWRTKVGIGVTAPPIAIGDQIFIGTNDGSVHALNRTNGEIEWTIQTKGPIKARPTWANGFLYISSTDGTLYAIR